MEKNQITIDPDRVEALTKCILDYLNKTCQGYHMFEVVYAIEAAKYNIYKRCQIMEKLKPCTNYEHSSDKSTKPTKDSDPS